MNYQNSFINFHGAVESSVQCKAEIMRELNDIFESNEDREQLIRVIDYLGVWQRKNLGTIDGESLQAGMINMAKREFVPNSESDLEALKEFMMKIINKYIIVDSSMSHMMNLDPKERFVSQDEIFRNMKISEMGEMNMRICELHNILNAVSMEEDKVKGCDFLKVAFGERFIAA